MNNPPLNQQIVIAAENGQLAHEQDCPRGKRAAPRAADTRRPEYIGYTYRADRGCPWDDAFCIVLFEGCKITCCDSCPAWTNQRAITQPAILEALLELHVDAAKEIAALLAIYTCEQ